MERGADGGAPTRAHTPSLPLCTPACTQSGGGVRERWCACAPSSLHTGWGAEREGGGVRPSWSVPPRVPPSPLRPPGVHPLPVGAPHVHPAPGRVPPVCTPLPVGAPHVHPPSWSRPPCLHPPSWSRPTCLHPLFARGAHTRWWPRGSVAASPALRSRVNGSGGGGLGRADPVCWARGQREGGGSPPCCPVRVSGGGGEGWKGGRTVCAPPRVPVCAQRGVTRTPALKGVGKRGVPPPCTRGEQGQGAGEGRAQAGARSKRGRALTVGGRGRGAGRVLCPSFPHIPTDTRRRVIYVLFYFVFIYLHLIYYGNYS